MKKRNNGLWFPCWIILTNGKIVEGFFDTSYVKNAKSQLKMVIKEGYEVPEGILPVSNVLVERNMPMTICFN